MVTEYSAQTGREMDSVSEPLAAQGGGVAATDGGVWVSFPTGHAGEAFELSAKSLKQIAPPANNPGVPPSTPTYQFGGVGASVSEGTLWVTSSPRATPESLTCADPATGAVRASESVQRTCRRLHCKRLVALRVPRKRPGDDYATGKVLWVIRGDQ